MEEGVEVVKEYVMIGRHVKLLEAWSAYEAGYRDGREIAPPRVIVDKFLDDLRRRLEYTIRSGRETGFILFYNPRLGLLYRSRVITGLARAWETRTPWTVPAKYGGYFVGTVHSHPEHLAWPSSGDLPHWADDEELVAIIIGGYEGKARIFYPDPGTYDLIDRTYRLKPPSIVRLPELLRYIYMLPVEVPL